MQKSELRACIVRAEAVAKLTARHSILLNLARVRNPSGLWPMVRRKAVLERYAGSAVPLAR
eukprot:2934665-Prymnesium_polylepis.1